MPYLWNNIALIPDDAYFTKWVKETKRLDHHQGFLNYLRPYLKGTMLDLGANIGTHSIYYARFGRVICFEANPIAFECLQHNMKDQNCELYNLAISDVVGDYIDMADTGDNYGAAFTKPGDSIQTVTVDSLELTACDYIKIDIEGDELKALIGAQKTIAKFRPVMCIECNEHTLVRRDLTGNDLVEYIHSLGYTTSVRKPEDISCDLLCLPS